MIRDFNVDWLEAKDYIPAQSFQTYITGAGIATGAPVFQEVGATGISGIQINQAADSIATVWHMGSSVDTSKQIRFRVLRVINSTDADAETFTLLYTPLVAGTTVLIAPATALSTAIGAHTYGAVAAVPTFTGYGIINRNTLASTVFALSIDIASTMTNASADEISVLGLEISYTPRMTGGPRRNILGGRRLHATYPSGVQLAATQEGL
jgi:hypothetical protein